MLNKKLLTIFVLTFVFWRFLGLDTRVANDFPLASGELMKQGFELPQAWSRMGSNFGEYAVSTLWSWPMDALYGLGALTGLSFAVLERLLGILPILLIGALSIYKFARYLKINNWFVVAAFYLVNTYILLVIDGGQLAGGLAYAWFPLAYLKVIQSVKTGIKGKVIAGLAVSILSLFDIRFVYVLLILLLLHFVYELFFIKKENIQRWIKDWTTSGVIVSVVLLGLNFYWIIIAISTKAPALPVTHTKVSQTSFLSFASWKHAFLMIQPHWYENVFGRVAPILKEFLLIPLFVMLAPVLVLFNKKRDERIKLKMLGFWLLVAVIGVFLVKGNNPPLSKVYPWLFANIPGFSLFRDPTKFFFLVALSYSVLIGITTDELVKRYKWSVVFLTKKVFIIPIFLVIYFVLLARPVYLGKMTGTFSVPYNKKEFFKVAETLKSADYFARVLWIPSRAPLGYVSPTHPSVEAGRLVQKRPFAIGTVGTYEIFNFLRESPFMGELFDIAAIKYLAYPYPDERREELKPDNVEYYYAFLDQLSNKDWIKGKVSEPPVAVLETQRNQDHLFISPNTFWVVGSDRIYWDLSDMGISFSDNALIFAEENPGVLERFEGASNATIVSYEKSSTDIAASLFDQSRFIFPAYLLDFDPTEEQKWWKRETADLIWWRNFLQQKYGIDSLDFDYGGGNAIAEGNLQLPITNFPSGSGQRQFSKGETLLARVMESGRGGKVEFWQKDEKMGEIKTMIDELEKREVTLSGYKEIPDQTLEYDGAEFNWTEVGELVSNEPLIIKTEGDINVVNSLLILPHDEWDWAKSKVEKLKGEGKIVIWENLDNDEKSLLFVVNDKPTVTYERISPTKYLVRIEGVSKSVTLAFSETYDPLWELDGQSSYPLYSLINGFYVDGDGEYEVFFSPQKYVYPGLAISGVTLLVVLVTLFIVRKRSKRPK